MLVIANLMECLYGVPTMSYEEEKALPATEKQTIGCKMSIVDKCGLMAKAVDQIKFRARATPIIDDAKHSEQIAEWEHMVLEANDLLWKIATYGVR